MNDKKQTELLSIYSSKFAEEYNLFPKSKTLIPYKYYVNNVSFRAVDGEILYCMIRHFKPKRIYEIGSGYSTYLSAEALKINETKYNCKGELVAFEPYPNETLKKGFPGLSKLVTTKIQDVDVSSFNVLEENDILFIDSTHVLKIGSDVQYEYLEILPRLKKGVIIHIHDIFLPSEYPKQWVLKDHKFWTEQYLLQAFLTFNDTFEILWGGSYMHLKHPDLLEKSFNSYNKKGWPGSFWMRKKKQ